MSQRTYNRIRSWGIFGWGVSLGILVALATAQPKEIIVREATDVRAERQALSNYIFRTYEEIRNDG